LFCLGCNDQSEETWNHFLECPAHEEAWKSIHTKLVHFISGKIKTKDKVAKMSTNDFTSFITKIIGSSERHLNFRSFSRNAAELMVEISFVKEIAHSLSLTLHASKNLAMEILNEFIGLMKMDLWIPRCE